MAAEHVALSAFGPSAFPVRESFCLAADPDAVSGAADRVLKFAERNHCPIGDRNEVLLALQEAFANAVLHGCGGDPSKIVTCVVGCDRKLGLLVIVRDPGDGFNPALVTSPLTGENLYSGSGRGIHLIRELMDEVHFSHNGSEILMRRYARS